MRLLAGGVVGAIWANLGLYVGSGGGGGISVLL